MTYRELREKLSSLTEEQLDQSVTVQDDAENECYPAIFDIAGEEHPSLDEDHPLLRF